jgi:hypothetical protein
MSDGPLTYEKLHWGTQKSGSVSVGYITGKCRSEGRAKAISYITRKGDEAGTYRHPFKKPGPRVLAADASGNLTVSADSTPELFELGRGADIECSDGSLIILGAGTWVGADEDGSHVWFVAEEPIGFGLERRKGNPIVTEHGIEN